MGVKFDKNLVEMTVDQRIQHCVALYMDLVTERQEIANNIKDLTKQMKDLGIDMKVVREAIKRNNNGDEFESMVENYQQLI